MTTEYEDGRKVQEVLDLAKEEDNQKVQEAMDNPDVKKITLVKMDGNMRNKPCPCGSGKKMKKCCGFNNPNKMETKHVHGADCECQEVVE